MAQLKTFWLHILNQGFRAFSLSNGVFPKAAQPCISPVEQFDSAESWLYIDAKHNMFYDDMV